jgi:4-hydroxy-tetrahydrodipicolinate synthase
MFSGCATALVTPFKANGDLDEEGLRQLVAFQESQGVDAIVPCGTTGESATLTHKEHIRVIEIVRDEAKRARIIAGAGSNATHEAIHLTRAAKDLGVDAVLSISPYYNKPTQKGLYSHYEAIEKAVDIPIIVYNVPGRTGSNINANTIARLAKLPNIAGVKEASGNMAQIMAILAEVDDDFDVISGDDALTFPLMTMGAKGVISVTSNIVPGMVADMTHAARDGDWVKAREIHFHLLPLFTNLFVETNPIPAKTALRLLGKPGGSLRLPLTEMEPANLEILRKTLSDLQLL